MVIFYPTTLGDHLDEIYEKGDIALSSLGWYKDGVKVENTLKSREYLAKGFPVIACCKVRGIKDKFPFAYKVPNNPSPINIEEILQFYDALLEKYTINEMQTQIREYAKNEVDMPVVMNSIIEFIEN